MCRLTLSFNGLFDCPVKICRLSTSSAFITLGTRRGCRATWVAGCCGQGISLAPSLRVCLELVACSTPIGGCGVGVCGGVPSGVPHALPFFFWVRDKYIAPLNLQKASSDEVKS